MYNNIKSWLHSIEVEIEDKKSFLMSTSALDHKLAEVISENTNPNLLHHSFFQEIEPSIPPTTVAILLQYARDIENKTVQEIANKHYVPVIDNLNINKGWLGNLVEIALGASAGSKPTQDFTQLGIELKTISINLSGKVTNDIFISTIPMKSFSLQSWDNSHVFYKLQHILFVPIYNNPNQELKDKTFQKAILWKPSIEELSILEEDWKQVIEIITTQSWNCLKSNIGEALTIKIKGTNSKSFIEAIDTDDFNHYIPPLSFYLRKSFVNKILEKYK